MRAPENIRRAASLKKFFELSQCHSRILNNSAHRLSIDRIMAGNSDDSIIFSHHDMLTLSDNLKTSLLENPNSLKMIDS
jgi:hypothetical protein